VGSPYVREIPGTGTGHHFTFQVINLWEIAPEVLKQTEFEALLPIHRMRVGHGFHETKQGLRYTISEVGSAQGAGLLAVAQSRAV